MERAASQPRGPNVHRDLRDGQVRGLRRVRGGGDDHGRRHSDRQLQSDLSDWRRDQHHRFDLRILGRHLHRQGGREKSDKHMVMGMYRPFRGIHRVLRGTRQRRHEPDFRGRRADYHLPGTADGHHGSENDSLDRQLGHAR